MAIDLVLIPGMIAAFHLPGRNAHTVAHISKHLRILVTLPLTVRTHSIDVSGVGPEWKFALTPSFLSQIRSGSAYIYYSGSDADADWACIFLVFLYVLFCVGTGLRFCLFFVCIL